MMSFNASAAAFLITSAALCFIGNDDIIVSSFSLSSSHRTKSSILREKSVCRISTAGISILLCSTSSSFKSRSELEKMRLYQSRISKSNEDEKDNDIIRNNKKNEKNRNVNGKSNINGSSSSSISLNVMTWNILADALATNEFVTLGGDVGNVAWNGNRDVEIGKMLTEAFREKDMSVVATHENDHPQWLLHEIRKSLPSVDMCIVSQHDGNLPTKYERCYIRRLSEAVSRDQQGICALPYNNGDTNIPRGPTSTARTKSCLNQHYQSSNNWLQTSDPTTRRSFCQAGITCTTNAEEYVLATTATQKDDHDHDKPNQLYIPSKAGTVLYYDTHKVTMIQHQTKHQCVEFATKGPSDVSFTIFASHLKSGINLKAEKTRCKQLTKLLTHAQKTPNPILLLDANSCLQYLKDLKLKSSKKNGFDNKQRKHHQWTTDVIQDFGFVNVVPDRGNECLKLRNYATYQPQKAGQFMFDTLDQILVLNPSSTHINDDDNDDDDNDTNNQCIPPISTHFLQISSDTYPPEYYDDYVKLRNTPALRRALRRIISDQKWESDIAPFLPNIKETFANYVEKICEEDKIDNNITLQNDISDLLTHLYPKAKVLPSDHPPVGASVQLRCPKSPFANGNSNGIQGTNGNSQKETTNGINGNTKPNGSKRKDASKPNGVNGDSNSINGDSTTLSTSEKETNIRK